MKKNYIIIFILSSIFLINCKKDDSNSSDIITDIDGNIYHAVTIGTQTWMLENLKTTHYRNGDAIPNIIDDSKWETSIGVYCDYNNNPINSATYGRLYNWYAASDFRNIAPKGWHVASKTEWFTLIYYLGGENFAGGKMKEADTIHWQNPNIGATNESGFTALPGGSREGSFWGINTRGYWWSSTDNYTSFNEATHYYIRNDDIIAKSIGYQKTPGYSIRCIKD